MGNVVHFDYHGGVTELAPMTRICALLIAAIILSLSLTSCGSSEDQETQAPPPPPPPAAQPTSAPAATPMPTVAPEEPADSEAADGGTVITVTEGSEALYRINEQLARRDLPNDAVGITSDIEGQIVFSADGTVDAERSKITVGVRSLQSDSGRRDSYIQRNSLESNQYPEVTLAVTELRGLSWPLPTSGEATFEMVGDLTIRDQTHPATWETTATFTDGGVEGLAKTVVTFDQYGMTKPRVAIVLSVVDEIRLEISFVATVSGG
ncbi:MAG: YceI family protein [Chloroflexota bacterium]|nr:YceI family protein [Chloroflexota bacterium]